MKKKKKSSQEKWEVGLGILENDVLRQKAEGPFSERRRAPRVSVAVPVHFKLKGKAKCWKIGESVDISKYGIRISSVSPEVKPGMTIALKVELPRTDEPVDVEGVIVWVKPSQKGNPTVECGISFESPARITRLEKLLTFLADKLCRFASRRSEHLRAYPAKSIEDLKSAYRLVYEQYVMRGYCEENKAKMYYSYFCQLPDSRTFLLKTEDEKFLGTISIIPDTACGLPMESVFPQEVQALRSPESRLAEVSLLALDLSVFEKKSFSLTDFDKLSASFKLFKILFNYAHQVLGVTDLLISMHPKHQGLYQYLKFKTMSNVRAYWFACNKPAVAMRLNVKEALDKTPKNKGVGAYFLRDTLPDDALKNYYKLDVIEVKKFLNEYRPLWKSIPQAHRRVFQVYYPELMKKEGSINLS